MRYALRYSIVLLAAAAVYGCGDDVTDPDAFLESAEAEAVMLSAEELPLLPDLMASAEPATSREEAVLLRARELWAAGNVDDERSDARRRLAIRYALPVLTDALSEEEWGAVQEGLEEWLLTVESLINRLALPAVEDRVAAARRYLTWAGGPVSDEQRRRYYLLLGMSELVETTPRFVARRLTREARDAVERAVASADAGDRAGVSDRTLARAVRLNGWADRAVVEGEYLLAIQRAYYAIQLVEGS